MIYGSVCSGIEAATVAWHPLGWTPAFFSEIDKFPSQVLANHYGSNLPGEPASINGVPNYGDMTKFKDWPDHAIDLLVGGTPCQSFSVAGLRKGLDDPRGNLMLTYLAIARRYKPKWLVWENVPGVLSSNKGRDFGTFLTSLGELGYGVAYRVLDAQYVRVDGFGRAVPQRRRRVFVVGYLGDWRRAAAVLLEPESLRGDPAPRRKAGKGVAPTISARTKGGGGLGTDFELDGGLISDAIAPALTGNPRGDHDGREGLLVGFGGGNTSGPIEVATTLTAHGVRQDFEVETLIACDAADTLDVGANQTFGFPGDVVAHSLRGDGFDASEDGTGRGTPIVPVAFDPNQITSKANRSIPRGDVLRTLPATSNPPHLATPWAVRRLMPVECERLQGFPEFSKSIRIDVCEDVKSAIAPSAGRHFQAQKQGQKEHALVHVRINLELSAVELRKAGRLLWSASNVGMKSKSPLSMPIDDFVRLAVHMTQTAEAKMLNGREASPASTNGFSHQLSGSAFAVVSGQEIAALASDAGRFTEMVNQCMKSITSPSGQNSQNSEPSLAILSSCAVAAISLCIPSEMPKGNSFSVIVETVFGYTNIQPKGKPTPDGPRYKALGNSMAVNCMRWLGRRIEMVEEITREIDGERS